MVSLLDIGPAAVAAKTVPVRGKDIPVYGVSLQSLIALIVRFPEMKSLLSGNASGIDAATMIRLIPSAVGAVIAAGTGQAGNEEVERIAENLGLEEQLNLITGILELTMPSGFGPFVERLTGFLGGGKGGAGITRELVTSSSKPSTTSSPRGMPNEPSGNQLQDASPQS